MKRCMNTTLPAPDLSKCKYQCLAYSMRNVSIDIRRVSPCVCRQTVRINEHCKDVVQYISPYFPDIVYLASRSDRRVCEGVCNVIGRIGMGTDTSWVVDDV